MDTKINLSDDELVELTQRTLPSAQKRQLIRMGIPYLDRPTGPYVLRKSLEVMLTAQPAKKKPSIKPVYSK